MLRHPNTLVSLGDGGAHVGMLCDASAFTYMLSHWVRDRAKGERMSLPWAVKRMTRDNALALGLEDRGLLQPGHKADLNVIDLDGLTLHCPEPVYDLPGGGRRLIQRAEGYAATVVSGTSLCIGTARRPARSPAACCGARRPAHGRALPDKAGRPA